MRLVIITNQLFTWNKNLLIPHIDPQLLNGLSFTIYILKFQLKMSL